MMTLKWVELTSGVTLKIGPDRGSDRARVRLANDGGMHVQMLGEYWVAVWYDGDEDAVLIPATRVKEVRLARDELLAAITAPDPGNDNVSGPARAATMAEAANDPRLTQNATATAIGKKQR